VQLRRWIAARLTHVEAEIPAVRAVLLLDLPFGFVQGFGEAQVATWRLLDDQEVAWETGKRSRRSKTLSCRNATRLTSGWQNGKRCCGMRGDCVANG
jgi:hypothetical protein